MFVFTNVRLKVKFLSLEPLNFGGVTIVRPPLVRNYFFSIQNNHWFS